jgi:7-dehydrocholesterol reductase
MPRSVSRGSRELNALLHAASEQGSYWVSPPTRSGSAPRDARAAAAASHTTARAAPTMWSSSSAGQSLGLFPSWLRSTVGPLMLILVTLPFPALLVYTCAHLGGSGVALVRALATDLAGTLRAAYVPITTRALAVLLGHSAWQLALMRLVPGGDFDGPVAPSGHVPKYVDNGVVSFVLTVAAFWGLSTWGVGHSLPPALHFSPTIFYDEYASLISFLPVAAFLLCLGLLVKGLTCPSTREAGSSGSPVVDFFWGTELYPRILGFDVKQFTNCRHGLMLWALIPLSFAAHAYEAHGSVTAALAVNVALQVIYVLKFFFFEKMYMSTVRGNATTPCARRVSHP